MDDNKLHSTKTDYLQTVHTRNNGDTMNTKVANNSRAVAAGSLTQS